MYVFCFGTRKTRASGTNKLTGIGINSIEDRLREPNCPFVLFVGTKKIIKRKEFEEYISDFQEYTPAFKRIGMKMVSYAIHEPELYKLLFMQEHPHGRSFSDTMGELGTMAGNCISLLQRDHDLTKEEATILFEQMWVYTFGIGSLCAMKVCDFTEEEIANRLGQIFIGQMMLIKSGQMNNVVGVPRKEGEGKEDFQITGGNET